MNRRPSKSRLEYDEFQKSGTIKAFSPDKHFFESNRHVSPVLVFAIVLFIGIFLCIVLNLLINCFPAMHEVSVPITGLPTEFDGMRILHISDLKGQRFGTAQSTLRQLLQRHPFDAAVLTGDMVSEHGNASPLYELLDVLHELCPDAPVYLIPGDRDPEPASMDYASSGSPFAPWVLGIRQRHAEWLNAPVVLERDKKRLVLMTLTQGTLDIATLSRRYESLYLDALSDGDENAIELAESNLKAVQELDRVRQSLGSEDILIGLSHTPPRDTFRANASGKPDSYAYSFILCGHTLGGLFRLPFLGPVFYPSQDMPLYGLFPGSAVPRGLYLQGRTRIYANSGLASSDPMYPFWFPRLFNRPELAILTLSASKL